MESVDVKVLVCSLLEGRTQLLPGGNVYNSFFQLGYFKTSEQFWTTLQHNYFKLIPKLDTHVDFPRNMYTYITAIQKHCVFYKIPLFMLSFSSFDRG
jgi:hypothetical protein